MSMTHNHLLATKAEPTYGDDAFSGATPTAWLGVLGEPGIQEKTVDIPAEETTADGLGGQMLRYGDKTDVSFTTYLVGKQSAAGDPPPAVLADIFKASNLEETITATTSAAYALAFGRAMASVPSMTVFEGIRDAVSGDYYTRLVKGVRGTPKYLFEDGQDARCEFTGVGLYSELSTVATAITAPSSYSGGKNRMKVQGVTFNYAGTEYDITKLEITPGTSIDEDRNATADYGVDEVGLYLAKGDKPGGSVTFKARSAVITDILPKIMPDAGSFTRVPTATLTVTLTDGTDTITITGHGCAFGAYAKNLAGHNYTFDVPLTFLDGLTVTFT